MSEHKWGQTTRTYMVALSNAVSTCDSSNDADSFWWMSTFSSWELRDMADVEEGGSGREEREGGREPLVQEKAPS